jgi:hypothetical protein
MQVAFDARRCHFALTAFVPEKVRKGGMKRGLHSLSGKP